MIRRRTFGTLLATGVLAAGLSGGVAAQSEVSGELSVLCTPQEDWCIKMVDEFQKATGIPTTYVRNSSGEALARLRAGAEDPEFDVWWGGPADGQIAGAAEGLLEPYVSPNAAAIPADKKAEDGTWTGVYVGALGFCSNQTELDRIGADVPDSWADLIDPIFDDDIQVAHPASSGTAYTTFYTQVSRLGSEDAGLEYMAKLNPNILSYTKSGSAPGGAAGRGEIATAIIFSHDCIKNIEAGFEDLVVSFPSEGTGFEIGAVALVANAPNSDAGKAWIDWALDADTQEIGPTVGSFQLPTNPDAAVSDLSVALDQVELVDYDFDAAGEARTRLTQRFEDEVAAKPADE